MSGHCARKAAKTGVSRSTSSVSLVVTRSSPAGLISCPASLRVKAVMSLVDALGELRHLVAGRRRDIAAAVPLEQLDAERLLDLAEAPEHGRMVEAERRRGGGQSAPFGDGLDQPEIVPGQVFGRDGSWRHCPTWRRRHQGARASMTAKRAGWRSRFSQAWRQAATAAPVQFRRGDFRASAPSPIRPWARAVSARKAGYSQPPLAALKSQPFGRVDHQRAEQDRQQRDRDIAAVEAGQDRKAAERVRPG